jgi:hypothetical protein
MLAKKNGGNKLFQQTIKFLPIIPVKNKTLAPKKLTKNG